MLLDDLVIVVETLQKRIRDHGASLRENETRTRMALIDPLLQALGWDVFNPAVVTPEYNLSGNRADYALLNVDGKPAAFVEAKRLGESLESHLMQMLNYANMSGVPYAGLTDGNHWKLYRVFDQAPIDDRRILNVSIVDRPAHESTLQLLLLWRLNLASGQPVPASEPILTVKPEPPSVPTASGPIVQPPPAANASGPIVQPPPAANPPTTDWVTLSSFTHIDAAKVPPLIWFSDGSEYSMQYWRHLVERTASWLWSRGLLTQGNLPVPVPGGSRYVVSAQPIHKSGQPFVAPQRIEGASVVVEGNVSSAQATNNAKILLEHCGVNPADVFVQDAP